MEAETHKEEIQKRADEIATGKGANTSSEVLKEAAQRESPLDEVRRLNKETKEMLTQMSQIKNDLNELASFSALSGKGFVQAPKPLTEEEEKQQKVIEMANRYMKVIK